MDNTLQCAGNDRGQAENVEGGHLATSFETEYGDATGQMEGSQVGEYPLSQINQILTHEIANKNMVSKPCPCPFYSITAFLRKESLPQASRRPGIQGGNSRNRHTTVRSRAWTVRVSISLPTGRTGVHGDVG